MGVGGLGWEFLLEMGGKPGMGERGWLYNGAWEIFKFSLHSWQRGANPLFSEDPLYWLPPFFQFCSSLPFPFHLQPHRYCSFCCPISLVKCGDHTTFDVLFYLMIIWIYTCQTLVP